MIPRSNPDLSQTEQDVTIDPRLLAELQRAYRRSPPLDAVDGAIQRAMAARVAQQEAPEQRTRSRRLLPLLSVPVAALVALTVGLGTYLHGQSPTPVSAQTVLHRAAAAGPGPNEAAHATYRISADGSVTGTADAGVGYDDTGAPNQFALMGVDPQSAPGSMIMGLVGGAKLARGPLAATAQRENLGGVAVYALRSSGDGDLTFYYNAQSYVLQGADWTEGGTLWQIRLASYTTMPLSTVPAGTFGKGVTAGSAGPCPILTQKPCQPPPTQTP